MVRQLHGSPSSITDVAALANVSIATVSRVLSGKRAKNDDISRRVREAAAQLDYSVNRAASSLRGTTTKMVGVVVPSTHDLFCSALIDALEPVIDDHSDQLILGLGATHDLQMSRIESLVDRNVDGLVVVCAPDTDLTDVFDRHAGQLPIVQIGEGRRSVHTSSVTIDQALSMEQVISHLATLNVKSVAYLAGEQFSFESAEMLSMLHTQLRAFGLTTQPSWNQFGPATVERGFNATMRILATDRPDAIVCVDDNVAFGAMVAIRALRLRVPQDIKVIGANDSPLSRESNPTLTTLRPPFEQIADEAMRLIERGPSCTSHISLVSQLIVRESTLGTAADMERQITSGAVTG